jgi:hypothetical protein
VLSTFWVGINEYFYITNFVRFGGVLLVFAICNGIYVRVFAAESWDFRGDRAKYCDGIAGNASPGGAYTLFTGPGAFLA